MKALPPACFGGKNHRCSGVGGRDASWPEGHDHAQSESEQLCQSGFRPDITQMSTILHTAQSRWRDDRCITPQSTVTDHDDVGLALS